MVLKKQALYEHYEKRHKIADATENTIEGEGQTENFVHNSKRGKFETETEVFGDFYVDCEESGEEFEKLTMKFRKFSGTWAVVGC